MKTLQFMQFMPIHLDRGKQLVALLALLLVVASGSISRSALADQPTQVVEPSGAATTSVNINTADAQTLAALLDGVGESRAQDIVRYRESFGPFKSVDELAAVKGIGQSTLDKNRTVIILE